MRKKLFLLSLTLVIAVSAAGCGAAPAGGNETIGNASGTEGPADSREEIDAESSVSNSEEDNTTARDSQEADAADAAASETNDDPYQFIFELEGHTYQLPCLVSELLENGFTINEENSELDIPAGSLGQIELVYNGLSYYPFVYNTTDSDDTAPGNYLLSSMSSGGISKPGYDLTIFRGITIGMSEDDLRDALDGLNVNVVSSDCTFYEIRESDGGSHQCYQILVMDGEVAVIIIDAPL